MMVAAMTMIVTVSNRPMPPRAIAEMEQLLAPLGSSKAGAFAIYEGRAARFMSGARFSDLHRDASERTTALLARAERDDGSVTSPMLAETAPFSRELGGRLWAMVDSGQFGPLPDTNFARFKPVGSSLSEHAFCLLLDSMRFRLEDDGTIANPVGLLNALAKIVCRIEATGVFEFLLTDGENVIGYNSTTTYFRTQTLDDVDILTVGNDYQPSQHGWACLLPRTLSVLNARGLREQFAVDCAAIQASGQAAFSDGDVDWNCS